MILNDNILSQCENLTRCTVSLASLSRLSFFIELFLICLPVTIPTPLKLLIN